MFRVNAKNIQKTYKIYDRPHHRLLEAVTRKPRHTIFNALEDVSFFVGLKQSLGIIGDNGAGKSTLLKLLAGTVQPTFGSIEMNGRLAALLELGAGFHPEFSGRQNIHLNASLLGISEAEIKEKENDIIEFAELAQFIDRPVKTYSSGMYIRLAFSIATTLEPDILIVDEALAVGDMAFQRKCIRRMHRFKEQGRTMLFCSHSMYHINELCDTVIWLENGRIKKAGPCHEVVGLYEDFCMKAKEKPLGVKPRTPAENTPDKECVIHSLTARYHDGKGIDHNCLDAGRQVVMEMTVQILADGVSPGFGFGVMNNQEDILGAGITHHDGIRCGPYPKGWVVVVRYLMDSLPLRFGSYLLVGAIADESGLLWYESKHLGPYTIRTEKGVGMVSFKGKWDIQDSGKNDHIEPKGVSI